MHGTSFHLTARGGRRAGRCLALVALCAVAPCLARPALAQRPAVIRATTVVTAPVTGFALRADTARGRKAAEARPLRVDGVGLLDVRSAAGSAVRVLASGPPVPAAPGDTVTSKVRPMRLMRITIDYVGS